MPKRIIEFESVWASDKLAACQEQNRVEYVWLYGLADANGSFEITNMRVVWGKVSPIRPSLTLERLTDVFRDFEEHGLMFTWEENGKKFAHWVGSTKPGRLPAEGHRARYQSFAPNVPMNQLLAYSKEHGMTDSGVSPDKVRTGRDGIGIGRDGIGFGVAAPQGAPESDWEYLNHPVYGEQRRKRLEAERSSTAKRKP
jgi:hypothetical protein